MSAQQTMVAVSIFVETQLDHITAHANKVLCSMKMIMIARKVVARYLHRCT